MVCFEYVGIFYTILALEGHRREVVADVERLWYVYVWGVVTATVGTMGERTGASSRLSIGLRALCPHAKACVELSLTHIRPVDRRAEEVPPVALLNRTKGPTSHITIKRYSRSVKNTAEITSQKKIA